MKLQNSNKFTGIVSDISSPQSYGQDGKQKMSITITENGLLDTQYPQSICITVYERNFEKVLWLEEWEVVTAEYKLQTNVYNGKTYNNINLWSIDRQTKKKDDLFDNEEDFI